MKKLNKILFLSLIASPAALGLISCDDNESYAELLTDETHAVNAWLANYRVNNTVPSDSVFITVDEAGDAAPYYRMDEDGMVYMQVVSAGDRSDKATADELIYFRFERASLLYWQKYDTLAWEGNANDFDYTSTSFRYGNYTLPSSAQWGSGIQLPLAYLGIDCVVNMVIKSQYGFTSEIANVIPYVYKVRYFRSAV
ncbi:MAG: DUF4827 domain-containing protein [Bacteroidales bacterium]|nr:DUF4827 domain-containing protein [Bacteroidales bacterium]